MIPSSSLSLYGRKVREIRNDRKTTILKMACDLNVTRSYLSAIELGNASPSRRIVEGTIQFFELGDDAAQELRNLAVQSSNALRVSLTGLTPAQKHLVQMLAAGVRDLSDDAANELAARLADDLKRDIQ